MNTITLNSSVINKVFDNEKFQDKLGYLYGRYLDEGKYEDINDYLKAIKAEIISILGEDAEHLDYKMTKRPWGIKIKGMYEFTLKSGQKKVMPAEVSITCNGHQMKWGAKSC